MEPQIIVPEQQQPISDNRITNVTRFYIHKQNKETIQIESGVTTHLSSKDQPWIRDCTATEAPLSLQYGWIESPRTIVIVSSKSEFQVQPSEAERSAYEDGILCVKYKSSSGGFLIPAGDTLVLHPTDPHDLEIYSLKGEKDFVLYAISE